MADCSTRADRAKAATSGPPKMTPEIADRLAREGAELRREYRARVRAMWDVSKEKRQARAR